MAALLRGAESAALESRKMPQMCAAMQLCIPLLRELVENVQNSNGQSQLFDANIKSESGPKYLTDVLDFCVHLTFV